MLASSTCSTCAGHQGVQVVVNRGAGHLGHQKEQVGLHGSSSTLSPISLSLLAVADLNDWGASVERPSTNWMIDTNTQPRHVGHKKGAPWFIFTAFYSPSLCCGGRSKLLGSLSKAATDRQSIHQTTHPISQKWTFNTGVHLPRFLPISCGGRSK